jgi:hypothetical protein
VDENARLLLASKQQDSEILRCSARVTNDSPEGCRRRQLCRTRTSDGQLDARNRDTATAKCTGFLRGGRGQSVALVTFVSEDISAPRKGRGPRGMRSTTVTRNPEVPAPALRCPDCDHPLIYLQTVTSGVKPLERRDYFECRSCGFFQYRHRGRKLRRTTVIPRLRGQS